MDQLFCTLDSRRIAELVRGAKNFVCYAAPGIHLEAAQAVADAATRLGPEMITVVLDFDERVMRMGFGDIESVEQLTRAGLLVRNSTGLRTALVIADEVGFVFTPTALLLEPEEKSQSIANAIRLSAEQQTEALSRLSPVAKAIAVAQAVDAVERQQISDLPVEVDSEPVTEEMIDHVHQKLEEAPPAKFDLARQVRVFSAYLQYVELKLTGAAIQRRRIPIPDSILNFGLNENVVGRLHTSFELIDTENELSSKPLEDELKKIRNDLTRPFGKEHGRVVSKAQKPLLESKLTVLREELEVYRARVAENLQASIDDSRDKIVEHYVPQILENPPQSLLGGLLRTKPTREDVQSWIRSELDKVIPKVDSLISNMQLHVHYKDITFETLNDSEFIELARKAFPQTDWQEIYAEFLAAGESDSD